MGLLIAAIALAASLVHPPAAPTTRQLAAGKALPQTLFTSSRPIEAFAQDGPLLAWFAPSVKACNAVWVLSLNNGGRIRLPDQTSTAHNVTCGWEVAPPVKLAIAGADVLWTLHENQAPLQFDYVLGAGVSDGRSSARFLREEGPPGPHQQLLQLPFRQHQFQGGPARR